MRRKLVWKWRQLWEMAIVVPRSDAGLYMRRGNLWRAKDKIRNELYLTTAVRCQECLEGHISCIGSRSLTLAR